MITDQTYYENIVEAVHNVTTDPEILEPIIAILTAWVRRWPSETFKIVDAEREFALPMKDLRGRDFYACGKIDLIGELPSGALFVHDAKSHRGPWRKSQSIDDCLKDFWIDWHQNIQTRFYSHVVTRMYPGRHYNDSFLIRVGVKPGPYNDAEVRERWFTLTHVERVVLNVQATMTHVLDLLESPLGESVWPAHDHNCMDKYHHQCPYWNLCTAGSQAGLHTENVVDYLPIVNNLDKPWIDVSNIRTFRDCPRRFYYNRVRRLFPPPPDYFIKGHAFHAGLEAHYKWIREHQ